jgi:hypothetical protein
MADEWITPRLPAADAFTVEHEKALDILKQRGSAEADNPAKERLPADLAPTGFDTRERNHFLSAGMSAKERVSPAAWVKLAVVAACLVALVAFAFSTDSNSDGSSAVYVTRTGSHYHRAGCQYLAKSSIPISLAEAAKHGDLPCSRCKPPLFVERPKPK